MTAAEKAYNDVARKLAEDGAQISNMFGMPSLKVKGKAFAGLAGDAMVFKLTGEPHKRALSEPGATLFEPMSGRPMKEWVQVPHSSAKKWLSFAQSAQEYCSTLKK